MSFQVARTLRLKLFDPLSLSLEGRRRSLRTCIFVAVPFGRTWPIATYSSFPSLPLLVKADMPYRSEHQ